MAKNLRSSDAQAGGRIANTILGIVSEIPGTTEPPRASPRERARVIANAAAIKASIVSGTLAVPPGPAALATMVLDLVAVWKLQAQMIADIAGTFGKSATLSREQMLYCLFKHSAAQAVRDLAVRIGERQLTRRGSVLVVQRAAAAIGARVTRRAVARGVGRWVPVVGVLGVAGYAYYDTAQVAGTAISLFEEPGTGATRASGRGRLRRSSQAKAQRRKASPAGRRKSRS